MKELKDILREDSGPHQFPLEEFALHLCADGYNTSNLARNSLTVIDVFVARLSSIQLYNSHEKPELSR